MSRRVGLCVLVFLTLSVPAAADSWIPVGADTTPPSREEFWAGRDGIIGNFSAVRVSGNGPDYRYHLVPVRAVEADTLGVFYPLKVHIFRQHLSAVLYDDGRPVRGYNGTISPDGRLVWGTCWDLPDSSPSSPSRAIWWATIDTGSHPAPPRQFGLNTVTVGELMAAGLSWSSAVTIVEGRLFGGPYRSVGEALLAPGLNEPEKKLIRERGLVR